MKRNVNARKSEEKKKSSTKENKLISTDKEVKKSHHGCNHLKQKRVTCQGGTGKTGGES